MWIVIGLVAGTLAGLVVRRSRKGFGRWQNLLIGLVGAVLGGFLFDLLGITIGAEIQFSLNDLIAGFVGSLIFLAGMVLIRRR